MKRSDYDASVNDVTEFDATIRFMIFNCCIKLIYIEMFKTKNQG